MSMVNGLTATSIKPALPAETTFILVDAAEYPIPELTTCTDAILLLTIIGLNLAPDPAPVVSTTSRSGVE